jgi:hypothetical protein
MTMTQSAHVIGWDTHRNPVAVRVISTHEATRLAGMLTAEALASRRSGVRSGFVFAVIDHPGNLVFLVHGDPLPADTAP